MKKSTRKKTLKALYVKVKEEHTEKLAKRSKKEQRSQGEIVREVFDRHL